jgi:hypothetical protein
VKRKKKEKKDEKGGVEKLPLTGFHPLGRWGTEKYKGKKSWGSNKFKRMCAGLLATTPSLLLTTFCCWCAGAIDMANAPPSLFASSLPTRRLPRTFCATVSSPSQRPPPPRRASLGMVCVCTAAPFLVT